MPAELTANQAIEKLEQTAHRMKSEETAARIVSAGKTRLILAKDAKSVFFASLVMRLKFAPDWNVDTAATDGRRLIYNPDFLQTLTEPELVGLLAHEVMHCVNKHFSRRSGRDASDWNIAADLAINPLLTESGFTLPDGALIPGEGQYRNFEPGRSAEEYYAQLQASKQPDPNGDDSTPGDQSGDQSGSADPGQCGGVIDPQADDGTPAESSEQTQLDSEWSANVAAAQQAAERRGELSAGLSRLCGAVLAPAADWKAELREYITRPAKRDYNWKRPNRRFVHQGLYLPSMNSLEIGHIIAAVDTSGSIGESTLTRFASELDDIARQGASKITILYHDSDIVRVDEWTPGNGPLTLTPCGGGGTDHGPVFEWIDQNTDEAPAVLICLTDLYSSFPDDQPAYPVLWAAADSSAPHPFGDRINIPAV